MNPDNQTNKEVAIPSSRKIPRKKWKPWIKWPVIASATIMSAAFIPAIAEVVYNREYISTQEQEILRMDQPDGEGLELRIRDSIVDLLNQHKVPSSQVGKIRVMTTRFDWAKIIPAGLNWTLSQSETDNPTEGECSSNPGFLSSHIRIGKPYWKGTLTHELGEQWALKVAEKPEFKALEEKAAQELAPILKGEREKLKSLRQGTQEYRIQLARVSGLENFETESRGERYHTLATGYQEYYGTGKPAGLFRNKNYMAGLEIAKRINAPVYEFGSDKLPITPNRVEVTIPQLKSIPKLASFYLGDYIGCIKETFSRKDSRNYARAFLAGAIGFWTGLYAYKRRKEKANKKATAA